MARSGQTRTMHPAIVRRLAVQRQGREDASGAAGGDMVAGIIQQVAAGDHRAQDRALGILHLGCDNVTGERLADAVANVWMRELPGGSAEAVVAAWEKLFAVDQLQSWQDSRAETVAELETFARTLVFELAQTPVAATRDATLPVVHQDMFEPFADRLTAFFYDQLEPAKTLRRWYKDAGLGTVAATGATRKIDRTLFRSALDEARFHKTPYSTTAEFVLSRPGAYMLAKNEYVNRVANALKADLAPGATSRLTRIQLRQYLDLIIRISDSS